MKILMYCYSNPTIGVWISSALCPSKNVIGHTRIGWRSSWWNFICNARATHTNDTLVPSVEINGSTIFMTMAMTMKIETNAHNTNNKSSLIMLWNTTSFMKLENRDVFKLKKKLLKLKIKLLKSFLSNQSSYSRWKMKYFKPKIKLIWTCSCIISIMKLENRDVK